jgi:hypothetical protein
MKRTHEAAKPVSAERIAGMADRGEDVSVFFKKQGRMVRGDVIAATLEELDQAARDLNISRQAVIKALNRSHRF